MPHFHAKLGGLNYKVLLESPKRIYYGNDIPITGHVLLKHLPLLRGLSQSPLNAELFGPLQVDVVLRGVCRINHLEESRAEVYQLCRETVNIYNAPFRAAADAEEELPFSIKIPANTIPNTNMAVAAVQDASGSWTFRERVSSVEVDPLPPTVEVKRKVDSWGTLGTTNLSTVLKTAISVQYTIEAQVRMPGIDVEIVYAGPEGGVPIYYDQPRIPTSIAAADQTLTSETSQTFTAQNEELRPEIELPQGFRNKTKALLRPADPPKFIFEASLIGIPQHAYIGQPLSFAITVAPDDSSSTKSVPNVFLDSCTITLIAHTTGCLPPDIELLRTKEADFSSSKPFGDEYGWTKAIDVGTLSWVPSTFTFRSISRTYKLRISVRFSVGGQKINTNRDVPLTIHPPLEIETSRPGIETSADPNALPSYREANLQAPEYLGEVPSYEQATSTTTHHGPAPAYVD
ncbi:hypothetical protein Slin15195_G058190 [Septoria linicola]|uniref:Arrestin-like N-terminal domain-containing protein n=1 Tax=Septoria linicola TaxID=215465 RepID=A0A9Q9EIY6_9PEZI|nr:hypothetical protein Slin14017_G074050 [Septoria linicola]USW52500.1 hypothetical protein Slin15195_G058190 [Septoria linicola]